MVPNVTARFLARFILITFIMCLYVIICACVYLIVIGCIYIDYRIRRVFGHLAGKGKMEILVRIIFNI